MQKRPMHGIGQIFENENPVCSPFSLTNKTAVGRIFQFFRNDKSRRRCVLTIREVQPHESGALLSFEVLQSKPWGQFRLSRLAAGNGRALTGGVVAPAV